MHRPPRCHRGGSVALMEGTLANSHLRRPSNETRQDTSFDSSNAPRCPPNSIALHRRCDLRDERWDPNHVRHRRWSVRRRTVLQCSAHSWVRQTCLPMVCRWVSGTISASGHARAHSRHRVLPEEEAYPVRHGLATFLAFAIAGSIPLAPYLIPDLDNPFLVSTLVALAAQFSVGALRSLVTTGRWWASGLEMLLLGVLVAVVAYGTGAGIASYVRSGG